MPRPGADIARDRLNPGRARVHGIHGPVRDSLIHSGVYRPANRWRSAPSTPHQQRPVKSQNNNILQRALLVAKHLPWLPKYNHARS